MEVNVAAEVEDLLALLDGHRRCKSNDTWVQDGAKDDNVAITFCWLHAWARNAHVTGLAVLEDFCYRRNILKVLSAITRRPWWNRTWTIQEIGLAQKSDVVLGGLGAPWGMLTAAAANIVTHRLNCCTAAFAEFAVGEVDVILEFCRKVLDIENTRRLCKSESSPQPSVTGHTVPPTIPISQDLWLLWFTRPREAFDARDKIFGLRGVMKSWSAGLPIEPDYSKPAQNVFRDLTTALIDQTKGYDVLIGNLGKSAYPELPQWLRNLDSLSIDMPEFTSSGQDQHPNEHPELVQLKRLAEYSPSYVDQVPSWVPDFAAPASTFERERVDRASLYSASSASVAPPPRILAGIALEVHTLPVDRIKHVGPVMIVAREASFNPILKQWVNLMICDAAERGYDLKSLGDRDYLNGGNMICAWQRTICMDSIPTTDAQVGQTTRYRRPDDYADALTHQRWAEGILDADDYDAIFGLRTGLNAKIPAPPGDSETALFGASVKSATFLRCFFITERGYFGLGPSQARVGDEVKVFLGGRVPFLVRAIGAASVPAVLSAQADACFSLVGDCFLQGIMDGERPLQAVRRGEECQACYLI
ncbi:hypothetical protein CKM354_001153700 [Cercospora kikuchii]|uniref:Heterokaryon incompatibility domain-containing protein n=1 Tax=Cercospora kikuchii TaxID=84275 RepID=A0A9P3D0F7_9PEZI|nr:uncharacterized protein CKM354_001153700 [Cercospora kikuchii]GIZ48478.1 hypothetical protein CKM354_001153700 [Cercospora kikuchii]